MCFPLTYLFNTRSGRDTKLFTLQPRTELKWFVNAGAESGLGVSVTGVDKHDTTHSFWVCLLGVHKEWRFGSAREGLTLQRARANKMCGTATEKDLKDARARYQEVRRDTKRRAMCRRVAQGIKMTPTAVRQPTADAVHGQFHGCESCSGLPIVMVTATSKASGRALEF